MPTFKGDRAVAASRPPHVGLPAKHVTKSDFNVLEQQLKTGFAKVEATIAQAHLLHHGHWPRWPGCRHCDPANARLTSRRASTPSYAATPTCISTNVP